MMKCCPKCNGRGTVGYFHIDHFVDIECDRCHGSGEVSEVPMTNEEWLHTMNAEQLAEFLVMIQMSVMHPVKRGAVDMEKFIEEVVMWLKQPHTVKE